MIVYQVSLQLQLQYHLGLVHKYLLQLQLGLQLQLSLQLQLQHCPEHRHLLLRYLNYLVHLYPSKLHRLLPNSSITFNYLLYLYPSNLLSNSIIFSSYYLRQSLLPSPYCIWTNLRMTLTSYTAIKGRILHLSVNQRPHLIYPLLPSP